MLKVGKPDVRTHSRFHTTPRLHDVTRGGLPWHREKQARRHPEAWMCCRCAAHHRRQRHQRDKQSPWVTQLQPAHAPNHKHGKLYIQATEFLTMTKLTLTSRRHQAWPCPQLWVRGLWQVGCHDVDMPLDHGFKNPVKIAGSVIVCHSSGILISWGSS